MIKPNCYNMAIPNSKHFSTIGNIHTINIITGESKMTKRHIFENDDNLISYIKNKTLVLDTRNNKKKIVDKNDYHTNTFYKSLTAGMVSVIDTRDNTTKSVTKKRL